MAPGERRVLLAYLSRHQLLQVIQLSRRAALQDDQSFPAYINPRTPSPTRHLAKSGRVQSVVNFANIWVPDNNPLCRQIDARGYGTCRHKDGYSSGPEAKFARFTMLWQDFCSTSSRSLSNMSRKSKGRITSKP
jgi:hypothetical protein